MLVASSQNERDCIAWETEKDESPFHCSGCSGEVILKKGKIREHHYAHKPPFDCVYGSGETQVHYKCKREIFEALKAHPDCSEYELEKWLGGVRPDVFVVVSFVNLKVKVAIEVQKSNIDFNEVARRSAIYDKLGVYVIWIIPKTSPKAVDRGYESWNGNEPVWIKEDVCRPSQWEKYFHAMYFGRAYYWQRGLLVSPYHFDSYELWVNDSPMDGGGGYWRFSKAFRTPIKYPHSLLNMIDDFVSYRRTVFHTEKWSIPSCRIWIDSLKPWWKKEENE